MKDIEKQIKKLLKEILPDPTDLQKLKSLGRIGRIGSGLSNVVPPTSVVRPVAIGTSGIPDIDKISQMDPMQTMRHGDSPVTPTTPTSAQQTPTYRSISENPPTDTSIDLPKFDLPEFDTAKVNVPELNPARFPKIEFDKEYLWSRGMRNIWGPSFESWSKNAINNARNNMIQSYIDGPSREAWLQRGMPESKYDLEVLPYILNDLETLKFSYGKPDARAAGSYSSDTHSIIIDPAEIMQLPEIRAMAPELQKRAWLNKISAVINHEIGHSTSLGPNKPQLLQHYMNQIGTDLLDVGGYPSKTTDSLGRVTIVDSERVGEGALTGRELENLNLDDDLIALRQSPGDTWPARPLSVIQAGEIRKLLDLPVQWQREYRFDTPGTRVGSANPTREAFLNQRVRPDQRGAVDRFQAWRYDVEEIRADVIGIRNTLGRQLKTQDIIDVCSGRTTKGSAALNVFGNFRDFINCTDPENTVKIFNRIVQISAGAVGAAAMTSGEDKQLQEDNKKINTFVKEEMKKLMLERSWPEGFNSAIDMPGPVGRAYRRLGLAPTTHDTRYKEPVGGGYTDEYGLEQSAGTQRVIPGEQLTNDIFMGTELWNKNLPGFYEGPYTLPHGPGRTREGWAYRGAGGAEGSSAEVSPPQNMGGSDALQRFAGVWDQPSGGWKEEQIQDQLGTRHRRIYPRAGLAQITNPLQTKDPRIININPEIENEQWQSHRAPGQHGGWTSKWGDMLTSVGDTSPEGLLRTYTNPRTGERYQRKIYNVSQPTEADYERAFKQWDQTGLRRPPFSVVPDEVKRMARGYANERSRRGYAGLQDHINLSNRGAHLPTPGWFRGGDIYKAPALWPDNVPGLSDAWTGLGSFASGVGRELGYHQPDPSTTTSVLEKRALDSAAQRMYDKRWDDLSDEQQERITKTSFTSEAGINPGYGFSPDYQLGALDFADLVAAPYLLKAPAALRAMGKTLPGEWRAMTNLQRSPTFQGAARGAIKGATRGADKFRRWRQGGGHWPWYPIKNARIRYPERTALPHVPDSLRGYRPIITPSGETVYQPARAANRGNLLPGRQRPEILVKESKLNDIFKEELEKLLKENKNKY